MAEIKKINVNGVEYDIAGSGGGSKLYRHSVYLSTIRTKIDIICDIAEPFTVDSFKTWLNSNGHIDNSTALACYSVEVGTRIKLGYGVYCHNNWLYTTTREYGWNITDGIFAFEFITTSTITIKSINDYVIEL